MHVLWSWCMYHVFQRACSTQVRSGGLGGEAPWESKGLGGRQAPLCLTLAITSTLGSNPPPPPHEKVWYRGPPEESWLAGWLRRSTISTSNIGFHVRFWVDEAIQHARGYADFWFLFTVFRFPFCNVSINLKTNKLCPPQQSIFRIQKPLNRHHQPVSLRICLTNNNSLRFGNRTSEN